jgi:hypothetical protein
MLQYYLKIQSCISLIISLLHVHSFSQDTSSNRQLSVTQPTYTTSRLVTEKPVIDGKLDDGCWKHGTWAGDYHQWIPEEGAEPTWPTEFNIQYDDKNLYVAFRAYDGEPDKIVRMSSGRDEFAGDVMGLTLDSYRDYRTGFEFTMTAWGQKIDVVVFNPADWDINWNAVWKGKVGMEDSAWVAEMEIPLSQLRYSNQHEQVWGMHTWRLISRLQEESNWEIQSKTGPGMLYNFGELRGINGLKKSRRLEIMPFILGDLKTMEKEPGNPFTENGRKWNGNMGLDAKIGVSSNFTLDLTINPDFGQVESDPSVMNLTAFETFYEEKRPFFLEGLTIFNYDFDRNDLFYSRRVGHSPSRTVNPNDTLFVNSPDKTTILSAVKFSGTTSKGLSVGLIQSITANEYARLSDQYDNRSKSKVEPLTNYLVARIQKGYKAGNTVIGGMLTSTNRFIEEESLEFLSNEAYTGGLDIRHHWKDKKFYLDAKLLGSYVGGSEKAITALQESSARYYQRPGADYLDYDTTRTSLSGFGGKFRIGKGSKGLWKYSAGVSWLSPGLEMNDLGYMNSADEINQENEITYFVTKPVSIFHSFEITLEQFNTWNFDGTWLGSGGHLSFTSIFRNNWSFGTNLIFHSQADDTRKLRGGPDMIMPHNLMTFGAVRTDPSKKLTFSFSYRYESAGNTSASSYELVPSVSIRPFSALKLILQADYENNHDRLQYITATNYLTENRYILGTIDQETLGLTFRANLNLTPEFSIQYYGSPFVSRGSYTEFKKITDPESGNFDDRFAVFTNVEVSGENIGLDENNDLLPDYYISDPDFNFYQFRSNLVAKWEYRLGSFIYLVWSSERTGRTNHSHASLGDSYDQLREVFPNNIFLVKLSYWFSL